MLSPDALSTTQELLILLASVKTGIISAMEDKSMSTEELAASLQADSRSVWTVCEALAALGYLISDGKRYGLSAEVKKMFFDPDDPNYTGLFFLHRHNMLKNWIRLDEVITSGKPVVYEKSKEQTKTFMEHMDFNAKKSAQGIADFCTGSLDNGKKVLDIGGGPLTYAKAFASLGAKVTVFDLSNVVEHMSLKAKEHNIEMVPGDFNENLPSGPFNLAFLGNICHIVGEQENRELFMKAHACLVPSGKIIIVDFIRGTGQKAAVFAVNMLVQTKNGGTWSLDQYSQWLTGAGFCNIKLHVVAGRQLISAQKQQVIKN
ncbi:MAG: methyltransferase [Eubacteriales bacterium]|jgi:SAM-dependent methyltransferase